MKRTILFLTLLCFISVGCKNQKGALEIQQIEYLEDNVVLRYSEKTETFWAINIPFGFEIKNNTSEDVKFTSWRYLFNNQIGRHSKLYSIKDERLVPVNPNEIKLINPNGKNRYIIYSQHILDTNNFGKNFFKSYLVEIKKRNLDTLNVGTLEAFKKEHRELIKSLIEGDSLELQFLKPNNDFEKPVKVPLMW